MPSTVAAFQSQSAFIGVGFTTLESEEIMDNPVRRRIIRALMVLGFGAITSTLGTVMVTFTRDGDSDIDQGRRLTFLGLGLLFL